MTNPKNATMTRIKRNGIKNICLIFFCYNSIFCNSQSIYLELVDSARAAYEKQDYTNAGLLYSKSVLIGKKNYPWIIYSSSYNAACSWSLTGQKDSALSYLLKAIDLGYTNEKHMLEDTDLKLLLSDSAILDKVKQEIKDKKAKKNKFLLIRKTLEKYGKEDQAIRDEYSIIKSTSDTVELKKAEKKMIYADSLRMKYVGHILDSVGYISSDLIGNEASIVMDIIVLHSNNLLLQEKYFKLFMQAYKDGKFPGSSIAYLQDKINVKKKLPQKYGTQLDYQSSKNCYLPFPIEDMNKLALLRKEMELEKWENYLLKFNICK